jgi:hypothetical protein
VGIEYLEGLGDIPAPKEVRYTQKVAADIARIVKATSPRYEQLAHTVYDAVKRGEKTSIWASVPVLQMVTHAFLWCCGLPTRQFHAQLDPAARAALVKDFNTPGLDSVQHLVCSPDVGGVGLNMQKGHHIVIVLDPPELLVILEQILGRAYRLGQLYDVVLYLLHVIDTHDDWSARRCFRASVVSMIASLDVRELMRMTGARCPQGQSVEAFGKSLKQDLDFFFYSRKASRLERMRHVTSFTKVAARAAKDSDSEDRSQPSEEDEEEEVAGAVLYDGQQYIVPPGYKELNPNEMLNHLFQLINGIKIPSVVAKDQDYHKFIEQGPEDVADEPDDEADEATADPAKASRKRKHNETTAELDRTLTMAMLYKKDSDDTCFIYKCTKPQLLACLRFANVEGVKASATKLQMQIKAHEVINGHYVADGIEPVPLPNMEDLAAYLKMLDAEGKSPKKKKPKQSKRKQKKPKTKNKAALIAADSEPESEHEGEKGGADTSGEA